jgi:hypothetical protein
LKESYTPKLVPANRRGWMLCLDVAVDTQLWALCWTFVFAVASMPAASAMALGSSWMSGDSSVAIKVRRAEL